MAATTFARRWKWLPALLASLLSCAAVAQDRFPSRPIEFIVPWGPGGGSDQTARMIAGLLEPELKVPLPVINLPGSTGNIGMAKLLSAPADGQTIAILAWDSFALLATQPPKWTVDDILPLGIVIQLPSALYVAGDRYPDFKAFEAAARARLLSIAISGFGSPDEITVNFLVSKGLQLNPIPYPKPGERYSALLGSHVDALYPPTGNVSSFVEGKRMRPILVLDGERLKEYESVPTSKESGYDITLPQRRAVIVRAGTDPVRVKLLSDALARVVATAKYKAYLKESFAVEQSYAPTREALEIMKRDLADMKQIVQTTPGKK
jgi:tripartite-type tricarboxylate transporter receptor subunit TctC